jgi:broad-specificity NMP kinase
MTKPLLIIELAGPAGAGKTTIRNALIKSNKTMQFGPVPQIRDVRNLPFFLWNWILLLPTFLVVLRAGKPRALTFRLSVRLSILNGWARQLKARYPTDTSVLILDQGPIYMLAELLRHCPVNFRTAAPTWWERTCQDWANTLDMVICLDTPDEILLQRVRTRNKNHGIKQNADQWAAEFLAQSRWAQGEVLISMMEKPSKMKVIPIDTSQSSLDELVQRICCLLEEEKKTK